MREVLQAAIATMTGLERHEVGVIFMLIAGVLIVSLPVDWIKRK